MRTVGPIKVVAECGMLRFLVADEESDATVAAPVLDLDDAQNLVLAINAEIRNARNAAVS